MRKKKTEQTVPNENFKSFFNYIQTNSNIYDAVVKASLSSNGNRKNLLDIENTTNDFYTENFHYS